MRKILKRVQGWLASHNRLRTFPDHLNKDVEYLRRGYLFGGGIGPDGKSRHTRFEWCLHEILVSDHDYLHNHPTAFFGIILCGSYREFTPEGAFVRRPGYMRVRGRKSLHRLEIIDGPVWTLFCFLNRKPKESNWGFFVNGKMVPHQLHLGETA